MRDTAQAPPAALAWSGNRGESDFGSFPAIFLRFWRNPGRRSQVGTEQEVQCISRMRNSLPG